MTASGVGSSRRGADLHWADARPGDGPPRQGPRLSAWRHRRGLRLSAWRHRQGHWLDDSGSVLVLILGYALIVMLLVTVLVAASVVFRAQRAVAAAADGAATAAADALDEPAYYRLGGRADALPLRASRVSAVVADYRDSSGLTGRYGDVGMQSALSPDATVITVTVSARVGVPFLNLVTSGEDRSGGIGVSAVASARSPLRS